MTQPDAELQTRLRLAHQARRAKERQLDDIRHALMDVGVIEEGDPYSHADLADVIRQLDSELNQELATETDAPGLKAQLTEAEALAGRWEEKYFEQGKKRSEALAAIDRVQRVSTAAPIAGPAQSDVDDWGSYLRGYELGVLATKFALRSPNEPAVSGDHPCVHCTHPKRAHLTDPIWCRKCPPETSYNGDPGWHEYKPAKEQR